MIYDSHYAIINISGKDGKETSLYLSFIPDKTDKGAVVYECVFLVCLVFLPEQCTSVMALGIRIQCKYSLPNTSLPKNLTILKNKQKKTPHYQVPQMKLSKI